MLERLAQEIVSQRTEVERFFLESLWARINGARPPGGVRVSHRGAGPAEPTEEVGVAK